VATLRRRCGDKNACLAAKVVGSRQCAASLCLQVPKLCTDLDQTLFKILILGARSEFSPGKKSQRSVLASCSHARVLASCLLRVDHVCITVDQVFRIHNNEFDEMPYKLDSTENSHSFKKYPT